MYLLNITLRTIKQNTKIELTVMGIEGSEQKMYFLNKVIELKLD